MSSERSAGWFADPTGRYEHRYWDGARWTDQVSHRGEPSVDPAGTEPSPPRDRPSGSTWDPPPAPTSRRAAWPWALAAALLAFTIGVGGCIAVSAIVASRVGDELTQRRDRHAITMSAYDDIEVGMTRREVIALLGKEPQSTSELVVDGVAERPGTECISYLEEGDILFPSFQFCFDGDGILTSKASA